MVLNVTSLWLTRTAARNIGVQRDQVISTIAVLTYLLVIVIGIGVQYVPRSVWGRAQAGFSVLNPVVQGLALAVCFMLLDVLGPAGPATFLYFRF